MSTNISTVNIHSGSLSIKNADAKRLLKQYESDLPGDCFLTDLDRRAEEILNIRRLAWCGEWSGRSFEIFKAHVVPCLIGEAIVEFVWERGDSSDVFRIKDGKMIKGRMVPVFDEDGGS